MFQVGDMVCYPMHGVGRVEAIQEHSILGETNQYYLLRFLMGRMTALVPVKNAQSVGLRPLIDEGTCGKVLAFLQSDSCSQESDNWNQRYRENLDKLKQGDALAVADVVKCLMRRDQERGLSAGERKMYLTARQVLVAELSASSGRGEEEFLPLVGGA
ncbi:MAG: CarD family transcriptional regulator [Clostridia bacterium]|nr:CarD family transcriptional regulator [Clostridia bacterium]